MTIEQIRQAAFDEGFAQGKEEGFSKGYEEGREQGTADGLAHGQAEGKKLGLEQATEEIEQKKLELSRLCWISYNSRYCKSISRLNSNCCSCVWRWPKL